MRENWSIGFSLVKGWKVSLIFIYAILIVMLTVEFSNGQQLSGKVKMQSSKLDSVSSRVTRKADSIKGGLNNKFSKLKDGARSGSSEWTDSTKLNRTIDSLKNLNLPTGKYEQKLDSIQNLGAKKIQSLENAVNEKKEKAETKIQSVESKINEVVAPQDKIELSKDLSLPDSELSMKDPTEGIKEKLNIQSTEIDQIRNKASELQEMPKKELEKLKDNETIGLLKEKTENVGKVTDQVKGYQQDIKSIGDGNLQEVKAIPQTLEGKVQKMDGVAELTGNQGELKKIVEATSEEKAKELVKAKAKDQLISIAAKDHFAGKEQLLQSALNKISTAKKKYGDLKTLNDSLKIKPTSLKGTPFKERVLIGITLQIQNSKGSSVDVNPWVGYRIHKRLSAGVGWTQRLIIKKDNNTPLGSAVVYGIRSFLDLELRKGFSVRLETERTYSPPVTDIPATEIEQEWRWIYMAGIKKKYTIFKTLKGNIQMLYDIHSLVSTPKFKAYNNFLSVRMGFEFSKYKR